MEDNGLHKFESVKIIAFCFLPVAGADKGKQGDPREGQKKRQKRGVNEEWTVRRAGAEVDRQDSGGETEVVRGAGTKLKTTWELLLPIWDVEDRPEAMQHVETVNAMSLENVFAYKQHYEQQRVIGPRCR